MYAQVGISPQRTYDPFKVVYEEAIVNLACLSKEGRWLENQYIQDVPICSHLLFVGGETIKKCAGAPQRVTRDPGACRAWKLRSAGSPFSSDSLLVA